MAQVQNFGESVFKDPITFNAATLRGETFLGRDWLALLQGTPVYGGLQHIEALVDPQSGRIAEFLAPDPLRCYEERIESAPGISISIPRVLSRRNPGCRPVIFVVDASSGAILDVVFRGALEHEAARILRESVVALLHASVASAA